MVIARRRSGVNRQNSEIHAPERRLVVLRKELRSAVSVQGEDASDCGSARVDAQLLKGMFEVLTHRMR